MKHILVIADLGFGSPYWIDFCESLVDFNYQVTVVCPKMTILQRKYLGVPMRPKFNLLETREFSMFYRRKESFPRLIRFILRYFMKQNRNSSKLDSHKFWIEPAIQLCKELNNSNRIDVIETSLPIESHIIAKKLKNVFEVPWIADYRDPFTFNHTKKLKPSPQEIKWETELLKNADCVTTTSMGFSRAISKVYKGEIIIVQNGYRKVYKKSSRKLEFPIQILYPGQIYFDFQNPGLILEVLRRINVGSFIYFEIVFSGVSTGVIKKYCLENFGSIPKWIKLKRHYSLNKSLKFQRCADILLLLNWEDLNQTGVMQTKLYEYIASGTFVLATGGSGMDESSKTLRSSGAGQILVHKLEIEDFLRGLIFDKKLDTARNDKFIETLSRFNQAEIFHKIIGKII